jgi:GNAT superfamily N-acetyltransferase
MTMSVQSVKLSEAHVGEAAAVLARAFYDDPLFTYLLPDDAHRETVMAPFMTVAARYTQPFGETYTTPATVLGSAGWLPPGQTEITEERMVQAGLAGVAELMGEEAMGRFMTFVEHMDELHKQAVPPEHWYLLVLGVDPPRQGQGVGGALIQPIVGRADKAGLPCYLETMKPRNVTFYQKHGFEVVVEDDIAGGGLHFWTMRRDPR